MIIYQTYDSEDMAQNDMFHPTLKEAVARIRSWGVKGSISLNQDGEWTGPIPGGYEAYLIRHVVKPTRADVCAALIFFPNR